MGLEILLVYPIVLIYFGTVENIGIIWLYLGGFLAYFNVFSTYFRVLGCIEVLSVYISYYFQYFSIKIKKDAAGISND